MRSEDHSSSLSEQVERAANEGMVDVAPPPIEAPAGADEDGSVEEARKTTRRLLELQLVAAGAYAAAIASLNAGKHLSIIEEAEELLRADIGALRVQLAQLHDVGDVEVSRIASAIVDKVTGIAAGMFGEAVSARGLRLAELAMARTAETLLERADLLTSVRTLVQQSVVAHAKERAALLQFAVN